MIGAPNSSNSVRLVEVAAHYGCAQVARWSSAPPRSTGAGLRGAEPLGLTAGASAPETLVDEVVDRLPRSATTSPIEEVRTTDENVVFKLPRAAGGRRMAVYTDVGDAELEAFLAEYDIGEPISVKGIAEGVENSNYLLTTTRGQFILTLYEKRVDPADLPFFLGLMDHLAARGITCPRPIHDRDGNALRRAGRQPAAIITFLHGLWPRRIAAAALRPGRRGARRAASRRPRFRAQRPNALSVAGWRPLFDGARRDIDGALARAAAGARLPRGQLAERPAVGRHPCRSVPRQRASSCTTSCPA